MKRCTHYYLLAIYESKSTMRYNLTSVTMAVIKKTEKTHVGEYLEKREPLCTVGGDVMMQTIWSTVRSFFRKLKIELPSVQFSSVAQSCPTLCDPMNWSMPGLPVYHQLLEFTETHIHRVSDAIQPSHPLSSPSPPSSNPSQRQSLFQ